MKLCGIFTFISTIVIISVIPAAQSGTKLHDLPSCKDDIDCLRDFEICHEDKCIHGCYIKDGKIVTKKCRDKAYCYILKPHKPVCKCYQGDYNDQCY